MCNLCALAFSSYFTFWRCSSLCTFFYYNFEMHFDFCLSPRVEDLNFSYCKMSKSKGINYSCMAWASFTLCEAWETWGWQEAYGVLWSADSVDCDIYDTNKAHDKPLIFSVFLHMSQISAAFSVKQPVKTIISIEFSICGLFDFLHTILAPPLCPVNHSFSHDLAVQLIQNFSWKHAVLENFFCEVLFFEVVSRKHFLHKALTSAWEPKVWTRMSSLLKGNTKQNRQSHLKQCAK